LMATTENGRLSTNAPIAGRTEVEKEKKCEEKAPECCGKPMAERRAVGGCGCKKVEGDRKIRACVEGEVYLRRRQKSFGDGFWGLVKKNKKKKYPNERNKKVGRRRLG